MDGGELSNFTCNLDVSKWKQNSRRAVRKRILLLLMARKSQYVVRMHAFCCRKCHRPKLPVQSSPNQSSLNLWSRRPVFHLMAKRINLVAHMTTVAGGLHLVTGEKLNKLIEVTLHHTQKWS